MSGGNPNSGGGRFPPSDLRGQGGWNRESYQLPHEGEARSKYDDAVEKESAGLTKPGPFERFKRWFSARF